MRRFTLLVLILAAVQLSVFMGFSWWSNAKCLAAGDLCNLVRYQLSKIEAPAATIDTLFIGDSSLGHALDAQLFSKLSGRRTISLALTGWNFNIPSYHNMLARAVERHRITNVVLFMTPQDFDVPTEAMEDPAFRGFFYTMGGDFSLFFQALIDYPLPILRRLMRVLTDRNSLKGGLALLRGQPQTSCDNCREYDYLEQSKEQLLPEAGFGPATRRYQPSLRRFENTCRQYGLNCIYMHGPVYRRAAELSRNMVKDVGDQVEKAGFLLASADPLFLEFEEVGDRVSHARPEMRATLTHRILTVLNPHLAPTEARPSAISWE